MTGVSIIKYGVDQNHVLDARPRGVWPGGRLIVSVNQSRFVA